jgi:hypothetical protein
MGVILERPDASKATGRGSRVENVQKRKLDQERSIDGWAKKLRVSMGMSPMGDQRYADSWKNGIDGPDPGGHWVCLMRRIGRS